ncbi:MAG: nucleotide sugar dehydrogenase [Phycisphaerales bacterium]|nr:nucleotide sugar dehydrogenase [Phycisphaerales bacterium]
MGDAEARLSELIRDRRATVGVVGLGYVGLPIARAMLDAGFRVVGFDVDAAKVEMLRSGEAYLKHLGQGFFDDLARNGNFAATNEPTRLSEADAILLCVPTPLGVHQEPDLSFVERSTAMVAEVLREGQMIVLESTSYPGTTREVCLPILDEAAQARGLHLGREWFLAFSPEREDPGRTSHSTRTTPRLVGGIEPASGRLAGALYRAAVERVVEVESAEIAEAAKLLENVYRAVNIALVNELKPVLASMGIDIWKVVEAASTKPYGFQPFYPGPGLGGHCIPIDPYYLTWRAREFGHATRFIELAGEVNRHMPALVVETLARALSDDGRAVNGAEVLVLGLAYKKNIDDVRETPAAEIIHLLLERGAIVEYHDAHVPEFPKMRKRRFPLRSVPLTPDLLGRVDAVLIVTDHDSVDYAMVGRHARLVVDTRNAMARVPHPSARVVKA